MINHLESGTCKSGITREKINQIIISHNANHIIASPWAIESLRADPRSRITSDESWAILTPSSSELDTLEQIESWTSSTTGSETLTPVIYTPDYSESVATGSVQGGDTQLSTGHSLFLCPLCPRGSNRFKTAHDLMRHSLSPAHAPKISRCPTILVDRVVGGETHKEVLDAEWGRKAYREWCLCWRQEGMP
jgi:hypothetical protein